MLFISDVMTKNVIAIPAQTTVVEIIDIFQENRIHHLPVTNANGRVIGIVHKNDLSRLLGHFSVYDKGRDLGIIGLERFHKLMAKDVMTHNISVLKEDDTINEAICVLRENVHHAIPVFRGSTLVGIITTHDILRHLIRQTASP